MKSLFERLKEYEESDYYGFHMPGHKRGGIIPEMESLFGIDITEIEGFDDLHHPEGILKESQERMAKLFGAEETCFLVNGSTVGILAGLLGAFQEGDKILVARNCHKSVYNGICLGRLRPVYLFPRIDGDTGLSEGIRGEDVRKQLEEDPEIKGVVLVSPTYEGVVSEIEEIAHIVHEKGLPLIVDEAHGAHFGFHLDLPANANANGADIVIHSLHKTLPALTQTALLHMNGDLVDRERVRHYLSMLQTSSPSYLFLASIDLCGKFLEEEKEEVFRPYLERLEKFRTALRPCRRVRLLETKDQEPSKLVIQAEGRTGREVAELLRREYHLETEMATDAYVLAMTSVADTKEGLNRLEAALKELEKKAEKTKKTAEVQEPVDLERLFQGRKNACEYTVFEVESLRRERGERWIPIEKSNGKVALEYAYLYPPGIPLLVPGEKITGEIISVLQYYKKLGFCIRGLKDEERIEVLGDGQAILFDGKKLVR